MIVTILVFNLQTKGDLVVLGFVAIVFHSIKHCVEEVTSVWIYFIIARFINAWSLHSKQWISRLFTAESLFCNLVIIKNYWPLGSQFGDFIALCSSLMLREMEALCEKLKTVHHICTGIFNMLQRFSTLNIWWADQRRTKQTKRNSVGLFSYSYVIVACTMLTQDLQTCARKSNAGMYISSQQASQYYMFDAAFVGFCTKI